MTHPIYTAGYQGHTPAELKAAADSLGAFVLDVRFKPSSHVPGWNQSELVEVLGERYRHAVGLGNPGAFDGKGMRLHDEKHGISLVAYYAKQAPVILLCACASFENCHRALISRTIARYNITTSELAWPIAAHEEGLIPCISLWQPWASAMAIGAKQIETRHWQLSYRGPLAIHAAKRWTSEEIEFLEDCPTAANPLRDAGYTWGRKPRLSTNLPLGAVIAVVNMKDCKPTTELRGKIQVQEAMFGNYQSGRFGWVTEGVRMLKEPIPTRGAQGVFKVPFPDELKEMQNV